MPFRIHLVIVACIIASVYLIWEFMHRATTAPQSPSARNIARMIAVTHASLGLNCRGMAIQNEAVPQDAFNGAGANPKLAEDNVFGAVSLRCNGRTECEIAVDDPGLGEDPAPECRPKVLEVEYRCFSYDRPWRVKASSGSVKLLCATPGK